MSIQNHSGERLGWVDALRAFAMILVVWGHIHAKENAAFFLLTGPVKIPLFFAITGFVFNDRDLRWGRFLKKTFFRIVIPWFVFSLVWLKMGYAAVSGHPENIWPAFYRFISGETHWYMPCLILAECMLFLIRKYVPDRAPQIAVSLLLTAAGLTLGHFGAAGFGMFNVACTAQGFILLGRVYRDRRAVLRGSWRWVLPAGLAVYAAGIAASAYFFPGQSLDVHLSRYYSIPLCAVLIAAGLITVMAAADKVNRFPAFLCYIGKNTLIIYLLHGYVRTAFSRGLSMLRWSLPKGLPGHVIEFVAVMLVTAACAMIVNRWFPFLLGRGIGKHGRDSRISAA